MQIGGSDQVGNIHTGHDLIKDYHSVDAFGLVCPLVTSEAGEKLGKSAGNSLWLDPDRSSPFDFYQFFMRSDDFEVEKLLQYFTFFPLNQIEGIVKKHMQKPELWHAQEKLAEQVTLLVHGQEGLNSARKCTDALYKGSIENLANLTPDEILHFAKNTRTIQMEFSNGLTLKEAATRSGCFSNETEAIRVIRQGGLYVNHVRISEPECVLVPGTHVLPNRVTLLRLGKRNYLIIRWIF